MSQPSTSIHRFCQLALAVGRATRLRSPRSKLSAVAVAVRLATWPLVEVPTDMLRVLLALLLKKLLPRLVREPASLMPCRCRREPTSVPEMTFKNKILGAGIPDAVIGGDILAGALRNHVTLDNVAQTDRSKVNAVALHADDVIIDNQAVRALDIDTFAAGILIEPNQGVIRADAATVLT